MLLNTVPRMPTNHSPHYLVYGREKHQSGTEHRVISDVNDTWKSLEEQEESMGVVYDQVAEEQRAAFEKNKRRYDLRSTVRSFKEGDLVFIKNYKQSSAGNNYTYKLAPVKIECRIKAVVKGTKNMYVIADMSGRELGTYHANQLFTR